MSGGGGGGAGGGGGGVGAGVVPRDGICCSIVKPGDGGLTVFCAELTARCAVDTSAFESDPPYPRTDGADSRFTLPLPCVRTS